MKAECSVRTPRCRQTVERMIDLNFIRIINGHMEMKTREWTRTIGFHFEFDV